MGDIVRLPRVAHSTSDARQSARGPRSGTPNVLLRGVLDRKEFKIAGAALSADQHRCHDVPEVPVRRGSRDEGALTATTARIGKAEVDLGHAQDSAQLPASC